jgi:drug/metabolite transporter superfamily protein YnfA
MALCAATASARQDWLHVEDGKLRGGDTNASDALGAAVALDGDTLIAGAPRADPGERGAAYVLVRTNGAWTEQAKITATIGAVSDFDRFGASVAVEGDTAVVGAPAWGASDAGSAYVFRRNGSTWTAAQALAIAAPFDAFGTAVAIRESTIAVSAPGRGIFNEGEIAIFEEISGAWTLQTWIPCAYPDDDVGMGASIALERTSPGTFTLITATNFDGAEVFQGGGASWTYVTSLSFGHFRVDSVAASGSTLAVGSRYMSASGVAQAGQGAVYVVNGASVTLQTTLQSPDPDADDHFGAAVALDGDVLAVGEPLDGDAWNPDLGAVYVYERAGAAWSVRAAIRPSDPGPSDRFGTSLALAGADLIAGAPEDSSAASLFAGAAYAIRIGFPAVTYCRSATSTGGCAAAMSSTGTPSASLATPFALHASVVDGQRAGIVFYGVDGPLASPWNPASLLCVRPPVQRTGAQSTGGTAGACDGSLSLDWNSFASSNPAALGQPFAAGEVVSAQAWYRDPPSPRTTELSGALAFVLLP